ncbi:MAG: CDP-glycerol glycerophosphotransferase family protein [Eubacteriaceae bacterium]|nr:CDP-glycerol glycerophosphotransferase family protein [Eubacteriaceae bacterium]
MENISITRIFWKRTYLFIEFSGAPLGSPVLTDGDRSYPFSVKPQCETGFRGKLNIAIAGGRTMLPAGDYTVCMDGKPVPCSDDVMLSCEDLARVYNYDEKQNAFVISFYMKNDALYMHCDYMKHNDAPEKRPGHRAFQKKLFNMYYKVCSAFHPKKGKNILLMSENHDAICDNLKALDKRLKQRELDREFNISYSFRNIFDGKRGLSSWLKVISLIAKQDFIFVDDYVPVFGFIDLDKNTKLIQVWHAGFGFKLVGYGRFGLEGSPHPFQSCHRKYDYALVGNKHLKEIYSEVFGIEKGSLLATGMPRLEEFMDMQTAAAAREYLLKKYPQLIGKKVITFAPTYRGSSQDEAHYDADRLDMDALYSYCTKTDTCIIFKMHHFIREPFPIDPKYKDRFYDMSSEDLNSIFQITDLLITDYSSCFYDFLLLGRPILFYVYDKIQYQATRGVHRPIDEVAPGKICNTFEELLSALENEDYGSAEAQDFLRDRASLSGKCASDRVIDRILLGQEDSEI